MAIDPRFGNSSGYFKDPISEEDLTVDMPRAVPCSFESGKFVWPCVLQSDGEKLLKIVYKLFTDEEKDLYKQYRGRDVGHSQVKRENKPKQVNKPVVSDESKQVIKHSEEAATSLETLMTLAQCDKCYGVAWISGIAYALVGDSHSNKIHHIPRSCIPDEEFNRICGGWE